MYGLSNQSFYREPWNNRTATYSELLDVSLLFPKGKKRKDKEKKEKFTFFVAIAE
jgi:hypothetical protein